MSVVYESSKCKSFYVTFKKELFCLVANDKTCEYICLGVFAHDLNPLPVKALLRCVVSNILGLSFPVPLFYFFMLIFLGCYCGFFLHAVVHHFFYSQIEIFPPNSETTIFIHL